VFAPKTAFHVTSWLTVPVPLTVAEHWLCRPVWIGSGEQLTEMELIVPAAVTEMLAVPCLLESCTDVAVTVSVDGEVTEGAVNIPELSTVPALAVQVTAVFALLVPPTIA
jgi:hypothetical protein